MNYDLNMSPNWLYEAAVLLSERDSDRTQGLIDNHSSFGISQEEMIEGLSKYVEYKEAVLPKIIPIFDEYSYLDRYFKDIKFPTEDRYAVAPTIASLIVKDTDNTDRRLSNDEIDIIVNDFIVDSVNGFAERLEKKELKIGNIDDLMEYLNKENVADEVKLILIDLYYNRYKVIEGIIDLLQKCAPICQEHFSIIKEDFNKAVDLVSHKDNINKLLEMNASIKINLNEGVEAFLGIANFNGISLVQGNDGFVMYVGIYFFDFLKLKTENRFNDTQIVNDLKALGDATRLKIVHLLGEEKMYVQEIANDLKLTPATISHHVDVLLKSELITITLDTEKPKTIYYELNYDKFQSLGSTVQSLGNSKEV